MRGINKVILVGNLGKKTELYLLEGNVQVAKFSLATTEVYKDKNGDTHTQTEWHTVVLWRGLASISDKYLDKGSLVYVEGRLKNRQWQDEAGVKHYATEVVADTLLMLDKKEVE